MTAKTTKPRDPRDSARGRTYRKAFITLHAPVWPSLPEGLTEARARTLASKLLPNEGEPTIVAVDAIRMVMPVDDSTTYTFHTKTKGGEPTTVYLKSLKHAASWVRTVGGQDGRSYKAFESPAEVRRLIDEALAGAEI